MKNGGWSYYQKSGIDTIKTQFNFSDNIHIEPHKEISDNKKAFYCRTAHRNESDFSISSISKQADLTSFDDFKNMSHNEALVSKNYQYMVADNIATLYDTEGEDKTRSQIVGELRDKINTSLHNIFGDLKFTSVGKPPIDNKFYFTKGTSHNFPYQNLSAGEKNVFDLLLDLHIKLKEYDDTVICIDEPESHIHTELQEKLLVELYNMVNDNSQMWLATHSIGMIKQAKYLENETPGTVVFLDFSDLDFDTPTRITPSNLDRELWKKCMEMTMGSMADLIAPETIIFCEGTDEAKGYKKNFDASIYTAIFGSQMPNIYFYSMGGCAQIEQDDNPLFSFVKAFNSKIIKVIDRDDRTDQEIKDAQNKGIKVLSKRDIENYLLDDEILVKFCDKMDIANPKTVIDIKNDLLKDSEKTSDDIKAISGKFYEKLKKDFSISQCGNSKSAFMIHTLAPLVTPDTEIYKELYNDIFG